MEIRTAFKRMLTKRGNFWAGPWNTSPPETCTRRLTGNNELRLLSGRANDLHANFYDLRSGLDDDVIREDLVNMAQLLDILEPMTEGS